MLWTGNPKEFMLWQVLQIKHSCLFATENYMFLRALIEVLCFCQCHVTVGHAFVYPVYNLSHKQFMPEMVVLHPILPRPQCASQCWMRMTIDRLLGECTIVWRYLRTRRLWRSSPLEPQIKTPGTVVWCTTKSLVLMPWAVLILLNNIC